MGGDFAGTTHPVVGDVDGDGHPDVVVGSRFAGGKALHVIRHDGTSVAGFPKNFWGEGGSLNTPAIADIDLDGRNEIVFREWRAGQPARHFGSIAFPAGPRPGRCPLSDLPGRHLSPER